MTAMIMRPEDTQATVMPGMKKRAAVKCMTYFSPLPSQIKLRPETSGSTGARTPKRALALLPTFAGLNKPVNAQHCRAKAAALQTR